MSEPITHYVVECLYSDVGWAIEEDDIAKWPTTLDAARARAAYLRKVFEPSEVRIVKMTRQVLP